MISRSGTEKITQYHLDELKEQLNARDKTIAMLELELNKKTKEYHSVIDQARHCDEIIDSVKSKKHISSLKTLFYYDFFNYE